MVRVICPKCSGSGYLSENCWSCGGKGYTVKRERYSNFALQNAHPIMIDKQVSCTCQGGKRRKLCSCTGGFIEKSTSEDPLLPISNPTYSGYSSSGGGGQDGCTCCTCVEMCCSCIGNLIKLIIGLAVLAGIIVLIIYLAHFL